MSIYLSDSAQPVAKPRLLLAEDSRINQQVALLLLKKLGYEADAVADGHEVLTALERRFYPIILMDIQMPAMDGLTATQQIHALYPPSQRPYIIALTGADMAGDREQCLAAGMQDYLTKPIQVTTLEAALNRALESQATAIATAAPSPAPPLTAPTHEPVLDQTVLDGLYRMAGAKAAVFLAEIAADFTADAPATIGAITEAIAQADAATLATAAHRLRSISASLGAAQLAALCATLEMAGQAGTIPADPTLPTTLQQTYTVAATALHQAIQANATATATDAPS